MDRSIIKKIKTQLQTERKADYLDVLHRNRQYLSAIPLPTTYADVDTTQAFRDAIREDVVLNGVRIVGEHRIEAFVAGVKRIASRFTPDRNRCLEISDRILRSCSRTLSGGDSYFTLHELFGSPSLVLKPRAQNLPPIDVKLGGEANILKCRIQTTNLFGLYRQEDINNIITTIRKSKDGDEVEAWVELDTVIVEIIDFSINSSMRYLGIQTPEAAPRIPKEVYELF